jgi:hypothetical protein
MKEYLLIEETTGRQFTVKSKTTNGAFSEAMKQYATKYGNYPSEKVFKILSSSNIKRGTE